MILKSTTHVSTVQSSAGQEKATKVIRLLARGTMDEAVLVEQKKSLGMTSADPELSANAMTSLLRAHPVLTSDEGKDLPAEDELLSTEAGPSSS